VWIRSTSIATVALALVLPAAAHAGPRDQVVVTGDVVVERGETAGDVVVVDGPIRVDGRVTGNVVAVHGAVTVSGRIDGTLTTVTDVARLRPGARVGGNLRYGDEKPEIAPGARVEGEVTDEGWSTAGTSGFRWVLRLAFWLAVSFSTLVLGLALVALFPRAGIAAWGVATERTIVAVAWSASVFFGVPILAVIAIGTVAGLPFGIGLLLALIPAAAVGYVTSCLLAGGFVLRRSGSSFKAFLAGWAMLRVLALIPFVGILTWVLASAFGLGVLAVAGWYAGRRPIETEPRTAI
jgi:hypothetical protein